MNQEARGLKVWVRGMVQGVGFRPFIFNLAESLALKGWVKNTSGGVEIEVSGAPAALERFVHTIQNDVPPLARVDDLRTEPVPANGYDRFEILESQPEEGAYIPISPDVAICPDCRTELFNPSDRRFRYPFINCTNCGPRFTIILDIPYDRPKTTMSGFPMCPDCRAEYDNPRNRRFHAQPVACPVCGPAVVFHPADEEDTHGLAKQNGLAGEKALTEARAWLRDGKILAVKGLGGFHLACDASNREAVAALRLRKKRSDKPFALMAFDVEAIRKHCQVTEEEAALLQSRQAPIVLLQRLAESSIAPEVAPGQASLGFMLPYTPLHLLLLAPSSAGETPFPDALVMTSGNLSEEPIAYRDEEGQERLVNLADAFLLHDRPIHMRVDDSVVRSAAGAPYIIRRARGFAPDPITLPTATAPILATGAELKNTFCLARDRYAFLSHHIGDLENYETLVSFEEGIDHFERLFRVTPHAIACDMHPNYLATRYAQARAQRQNLPLAAIQHHHAHLAACLADAGWNSPEPAAGLIFDGTGYGTDGAIWGGEVLVGGYERYTRRFHLAYTPLPGGDSAVRRPARMALAHLWAAGIDWETDLPPMQDLCEEERSLLRAQLERKINAPPTSSMGRLFDAASALLGVRQKVTYESQAAIELEALADPNERGSYSFALRETIIDPAPLWEGLLADWRRGASTPALAARFHNSIARLALDLCQILRAEQDIRVIALSGGVWQNRFLLERTVNALGQAGFQVLVHRQMPANDGCIALGQVMVASRRFTGEAAFDGQMDHIER
jgi:hydrogenase maturation protein HypF